MTDTVADQEPVEPTGTTIDGTPWEEPRPPHLPDTVTGLPLVTILLTAAAAVTAFLTIRDLDLPPAATPMDVVTALLSVTPVIVSFLIPAALFLRHRDAWSAHRTLALGTILLAVGRVIGQLTSLLDGWFDSIIPPPEDQPWLNPFSIALQIVISAVAVLAVIYMARGLIQARVYEDERGTRFWWAVVVLMAVVAGAMGLLLLGTLPIDAPEEALVSSYWLVMLSIAINIATVAAWAYFTGNAIAGRIAGERPRLGWFLASLSGMCILILFLISGLATGFSVMTQSNAPSTVLTLLTVLPGIAYLLLFVAFLLRLPTTHAPVDEEEVAEVPAGDEVAEDLAGSTA
jgi:MFS family permease